MSVDIYDLNCPFCDKVYKLPRDKVIKHVGKTIYCRGCGKPFSVPPLPLFESHAGFVLEHVEAGGSSAGAPAINHFESDSVPIAARAQGADEALPPPFSAAVLPPIDQVIHSIDEPPTANLAAAAEAAGDDVELPPYRSNEEHGALAVEEAGNSIDSPYAESHAESPQIELSPIALPHVELPGYDSLAAQPVDLNEAGIDDRPESFFDGTLAGYDTGGSAISKMEIPSDGAIEPEPLPPAKPPRKKRVRSAPKAPVAVVPQFDPPVELPVDRPVELPVHPAEMDLADVPVARTIAPPPTPAPATAPSIDLSPLISRLTFLALMSVLIVLLLAAIVLALLGYLPHRPA